ncbi:MAG: transglutaminase domain-containing protein [Flavobacteriales bacterium]|nr:transglutaminase domain-containing protein [Flavobacteriales bacterium]
MKGVFIILISGFSLLSLIYLIKELREVRFLKQLLLRILGKKKLETLSDISTLKMYLNENIRYNPEWKSKKRPLLRHTASQILTSNYGFCGENARVSIKLFLLSGIKARRIYLFGTKWQHVVVEHEHESTWYLFDGHYDPKTVLGNDQIAQIESDQIASYPNAYSENPYVDYCRIKLFYRIPLLRAWAKLRLPGSLVYFFESPYLIQSYALLNIALALLLFTLIKY